MARFSWILLAASAAAPVPCAAAAVDASPPAGLAADEPSVGLCLLQDARARGLRATRRSGGDLTEPSVSASPLSEPGCDAGVFATAFEHQPPYWNKKNGDASSTGASTFVAGVNVSDGPRWSFKDETASIVTAHPIIDADKFIYLSHRNGKLRKFSPEGKLLWTNADLFEGQTKQPVTGSPVLMDGVLYVGDQHGNTTAIDASTGATRWSVNVGLRAGADSWSMAALAGVVVTIVSTHPAPPIDFGGNDQIVALDATDGRVMWRRSLPDGEKAYNFLGSFVDNPPSIMLSTWFGRPMRYRLCDGEAVWTGALPEFKEGETPDMSTGGMVIGGDGLAFVTSNSNDSGAKRGRLSAYHVATGDLAWSRRTDMQTNTAPALGKLSGPSSGVSVVISTGENPSFPNPIADAMGEHWLNGKPVEWKGLVLAFDAATGEPMPWRWEAPPHRKPQAEGDTFEGGGSHICLPDAWSNPAIDAEGSVFVGHMSGNIFQLRDINGDGRIDEAAGEVQRFYGGRCYQASPGIAEGMMISTPCDGMHVFRAR